MMNLTRRIAVAAAVAAMLVAAAPAAVAQTVPAESAASPAESAASTATFEARRAAIVERIAGRSDAVAGRIADLSAISSRLDQLAADVAGAISREDVRAIADAARSDLEALRESAHRRAYTALIAHVGDDIATFSDRADRLAEAIERAAAGGGDVAAAATELRVAVADIDLAATLLASLPTEGALEDLMPLAREAHAVVHKGQGHLRAAFALLSADGGAFRTPLGEALAF